MAIEINPQTLPPDDSAWREAAASWRTSDAVRRLWNRDASLWTSSDEHRWLDWLTIVEGQLARPGHLSELRADVESTGFRDILLLGMGGSSLCPDVLAKTFGQVEGFPELHVLDSTDPAQLLATAEKIDLERTLFFVSSKSGSTLEPDILRRHFYRLAGETLGRRPGDRFIAVTDPGSQLEEIASRDGYRHIFYGLPRIGGRYSALSNFGMAPAAAAGLDAVRFLEAAQAMAEACGPETDPAVNPGVALGLLLGSLAEQGRDKLTFVASREIASLGAWLEQLIAESTGKLGKAIIPVDLETLGAPEIYGDDRVFVQLCLGEDRPGDPELAQLEAAGHPVVRIVCRRKLDLAQEFFRWEIATAVAGSVMGIHPFNQPDVEASKIASRKITEEYEQTRSLPTEKAFFEAEGVKLFADSPYAVKLARAADQESLEGYLAAHLERLGDGDYLALLAYIEMNPPHQEALQAIRHRIRDARRTATCLGFGPRFLHSTGQAYKGGPNSGVVIQLTCDDKRDVDVPGREYTFGVVKAAQARGDFQVLAERDRRALRLHLGDVASGLRAIDRAVEAALA